MSNQQQLTSIINEKQKKQNKSVNFAENNTIEYEKDENRKKSNAQDLNLSLNIQQNKNGMKQGFNLYQHLNLLKSRVSIQFICPKTEGNDEDEEDEKNVSEIDKYKLDRQKGMFYDIKRNSSKKGQTLLQQIDEHNRPNKSNFLNQKQTQINNNPFQLLINEQKNNQTQKKNNDIPQTLTIDQKQKAKENLQRIFRKGMVYNNAAKIFISLISAKYIQKKASSLFDPQKQNSKIDQQKNKYFQDLFLSKGIFSKEYQDPQNEFLKALLNLPISLQNPIHSEIASTFLKKKLKSSLEMQYLSRCLMNLELFKQNQNILEDPASQKIIFSEIHYVFLQKNTIIFNFGKVFCFIPRPEKKDKLLNEQIDIERQAIKSKINIPNLPSNLFNQQTQYQQLQSQISSPKRKSSIAYQKSDSIQNFTDRLSPSQMRQSFLGSDKSDKQFQSLKQQSSRFVFLKSGEANDDTESEANTVDELDEPTSMQDSVQKIMKMTINKKNTKDNQKQKKNSVIGGENINEDLVFQQTFFPDMNMVKIYQPGEAFGEIALMTKERRTASLVCKEDTHLMVLSKEGFDKILGSYQKSIIRQKVLFLKSFSFFETIANSQLMSLLHFFDVRQYNQKQIIYQENDDTNQVFFIKSGEVQIQKQISVDGVAQTKQISEMNYIKENQTNRLFNKNIQARGKNQQKKVISLKILGPLQYFGQDEILSSLPKRQFRAIALQHSEIYVISKKDLFTTLKQHKQMEIFKQQNDVKQQWQKHREIEAIQLASIRESVNQQKVQQTPIEQISPINKFTQAQQKGSTSPSFQIDKSKNIKYDNLTINTLFNNTFNEATSPIYTQKLMNLQESNRNIEINQNTLTQSEFFQQKFKGNLNANNQYSLNCSSPNIFNYKTSESFINKSNVKEFDNIENTNSSSPVYSKIKEIKIPEQRIFKTLEDEDEEIKIPQKKKMQYASQQDILNSNKKTLEKISNKQHKNNSMIENSSSHIFQLQQLQKINSQNQEIMKEMQKAKLNNSQLDKQLNDIQFQGLGFDIPSDLNSSKGRREYKMQNNLRYKQFIADQICNSSLKQDQRISKSFDKKQEIQFDISPQNNVFKMRQQKFIQQKEMLKAQSNSLPKLKQKTESYNNKTSEFQYHDTSQIIMESKDQILTSKRNSQQFTNTTESYLTVQQIQKNNRKLSEQGNSNLKQRNINFSRNNSFHDQSKSNENSPILTFYQSIDDVKEDRERNKKDLNPLNLSSIQQQQPQKQEQEKKKKQTFISQFFQNNDIVKNKSIQKIIKCQQRNQYLFKQIYPNNERLQDHSINIPNLNSNN